jgi:hypothetical protein
VNLLSPRDVLREVAAALPLDCRGSVIIIGSLAAGYHYFRDDPESLIRTKDVDCMLSPHIKAVPAGKAVVESLFAAQWQLRKDEPWNAPGTAATPTEQLPLVRLHPPGSNDWFIELMISPPSAKSKDADKTIRTDPQNPGKQYVRIATERGHFALCSFGYLSLVEEQPFLTEFGIAIARPEMMALANLLHHPAIGTETMSGLISERRIKRSNKDLGRVLALAYLAMEQNEDALRGWPERWAAAMKKRFPEDWAALGARAGSGLRQLLASPPNVDEASHTCASGLLASRRLTPQQLRIAGLRLVQDAVEPLEATVRK